MATTHLSGELIAAYQSACYRADSASGPIILRIDQYSAPLSRLLSASGQRCAAFITACNPLGMQKRPEENEIASRWLRDRLDQHVSRSENIMKGVGFDPSGNWPGEESFLVLGLTLEAARMLGEEFQQNAIVWADSDAIPRLILLR